MRRRPGSAESVVLPVPESPKNSAVTPSAPTLAEQCMGKTLRCGSTKFITPKMDFFISPAYSVPPISTSFLLKFTNTKTSELVPSRSGSARKLGALTMVNSGLWVFNSSSGGTNE